MQRDMLIIIGVALVAIVIGLATLFLSGSSTPSSTPAVNSQPSAIAVPFERLIQGQQSAIAERANYSITSSDQLAELWQMVKATSTPPTIDFSKQQVLAVFTGKVPNASIAIAKIEDTDVRMVSIAVTQPDGSCTKTTKTAPFEMVVVPLSSLPLTHQDIVATTSCSN